MKKQYQSPALEVLALEFERSILQSSVVDETIESVETTGQEYQEIDLTGYEHRWE